MNKKNLLKIIMILIALALIAAGITVFLTLRHNSNDRLKNESYSGEGMFGTWNSDYSDCVVIIDKDGKVTEFYGEDKRTAICSMEELENGSIKLVPREGGFYFANYYLYEVINDEQHLTSYIFLDNQELVIEEYISFHK